jgi:hypothetical protein
MGFQTDRIEIPIVLKRFELLHSVDDPASHVSADLEGSA